MPLLVLAVMILYMIPFATRSATVDVSMGLPRESAHKTALVRVSVVYFHRGSRAAGMSTMAVSTIIYLRVRWGMGLVSVA